MSLLSNLVSYWKLDEASGNAIDAHGTNTLTQNNAPGTTTGKVLGARTFNGSSDYFSIASNATLQTGDVDFTLACWVKFNSISSAQTVVGKWVVAPTGREYRVIFDNSPNRLQFQVSATGASAVTVSANNFGGLSTGVWYYVIAWHDSVANTTNISVNGVENSASHSAGVFAGSTIFVIGRSGAALPTNGTIDECGFWKRVLTADERTQLYNGGAALSYDSFNRLKYSVNNKTPVSVWIPSRDTAGNGTTTLTDLVGSNNGTLTDMDPATDWVVSDGRTALDFDGSNDHVSASSIPITVSTPFSISAWIKTSTTGAIISDWNIGPAGGWMIDVRGGFSRIQFGLYGTDGSTSRRAMGGTVVTNNAWRHIVATYDGSQSANGIKIYVDGVAETMTIINDTSPVGFANTAINIGARAGAGLFFSGQQDDVRVFTGIVLSTLDVSYLYPGWSRSWTTVEGRTI